MLFDPSCVDAIPLALRTAPQWVCWTWSVNRQGQPTKKPMDPRRVGRGASHSAPTTWSDFDTALHLATSQPDIYGLGFVFNQPTCAFFGLDLDKVGQDSTRFSLGEAQAILARLRHTYAERSPSRAGYHVIGCGAVKKAIKTPRGELYGTKRFFTVTGDRLPDHPSTTADISPTDLAWVAAQLRRPAASPLEPTYTPAPAPPDDAAFPFRLFDTLMTLHGAFAATWNRRGKHYDSPSEEEMALGRHMVTAGWNDQDIMAVWRAWRVKHSLPPKHAAALESTLVTLRKDTSPKDSSADIDRETARVEVEMLFGLRIERLVCTSRDPGTFHVHFAGRTDGVVIPSYDEYVKQATWLKLAFLHTGVDRVPLTPRKWHQKRIYLSALVEYREGEETETPDETREWIAHFLGKNRVMPLGYDALTHEYAVTQDDATYLPLTALLEHVKVHFARGITRPVLISRLSAIGWTSTRLYATNGVGIETRKRYWYSSTPPTHKNSPVDVSGLLI